MVLTASHCDATRAARNHSGNNYAIEEMAQTFLNYLKLMIKINTSNVLILFALVINSAICFLPPRIQQALQSVCGGAYCEDGPIGTFIGYWKWITSSIQLDDSTGEYQRTLGTFSNVFSLTKATSSPESLYQTVRLISILIDLWKWLLCASVCLRMVAINFSALWKNTMDNMDRLWEITRKRKKNEPSLMPLK